MKKLVALLLVAIMMLSSTIVPSYAINEQRGGVMGFIAGCCFGVRAAAAYNDGKEIHWREWIVLAPLVSILFAPVSI